MFRRFIGVFARPEHPLALFLDDLQWLDAATLDLLEDLLIHPDVRHLMLIGAYRNNEVNSAHALMRKLAAIRHAGGAVQEIVLAPLAFEDLRQLIADSLHGETSTARLRAWSTRRLVATHFSPINLLLPLPKKAYSASIIALRAGLGI